MSPGSHLLASWLLANSLTNNQRDRRVVALAGLAPDIDGLGWLLDRGNSWLGSSSDYYFQYHHLVGHNFAASLAIAAAACLLATRRSLGVFLAALLAVHLHFLCDVAGSRGPDGYQWPIPYFLPWDAETLWTWSGQWELNAWQNLAITLVMLSIAMAWSWRQRYSFVEVISAALDREFFKLLARYCRT